MPQIISHYDQIQRLIQASAPSARKGIVRNEAGTGWEFGPLARTDLANTFTQSQTFNQLVTGPSGSYLQFFSGTGGSISAFISPPHTGGNGVVVRGLSGQGAALYRGQNSGGADLFIVGASGELYTILSSASVAGHIIRGAPSQSANLTEWQNSAGSILSRFDSGGNLFIFTNSNYYATKLTVMGSAVGDVTKQAIAAFATDSTHKTGLYIRANDTAVYLNATWGVSSVNADLILGGITSAGNYQETIIAGAAGTVTITPGSASVIPLTIKAAASQSANLTDWQNSVGTVLARISSAGSGYITDNLVVNTGGTNPYIALSINGVDKAYLQTISDNASFSVVGNNSFAIRTNGSDRLTVNGVGNVLVNGFTAATVGLIVKGAASQSANLFEAQNSSSTIMTSIGPHGAITHIQPNTGSGTPRMFSLSGTTFTGATASAEIIDVDWNLARTVQRATGNVGGQRVIRIQAPTYSFVGASTITDAVTFEISGSPLAGANATITTTSSMRVRTGQADGKGITIMGFGFQAANLFEAQNSSAAVLSTISENGYYTTRKTAAPDDAELTAGELAWWFDSSDGAAKAMFKGKTADGTVVNAELPMS